ncbi:MAG TPA: divalent cation tolerance protein CutA, partial [Thermoanaerobaculia bacterium]|nr:divalent cation tolerance protein CutA [Thermoanaerobaculia bacterium]
MLTALMQPLLVLTTVAADFNARALAHDLVDRRLAACVNIAGPLQSVYRWEGRVAEDEELILL